MIMKKRKFKKNYIVALLFLIGVLFLVLETTGKTSILLNRDRGDTKSSAKTTSTLPTAQSDFSDGDNRKPSDNSSSTEGTVKDTSGEIIVSIPEHLWSTSLSGLITVYSPIKNSLLRPGDTITGKATAPSVSFRLIDDVSGVIAEGRLTVNDGKFSGKFDFSTLGMEGRLDVFSTLSNGREENNIEIPVKFK